MFNLVLYQPEIPPNTGNIIRLCANTGCSLHLIKPLGFELDHPRVWAFSTKGGPSHASVAYEPGDVLLFGPETRGLPADILGGLPIGRCLRIPLLPEQRSLNLSNAASIVVYEAWRQQGFAGAG